MHDYCRPPFSQLCTRCARLAVAVPANHRGSGKYPKLQLSEFAEPLRQLRATGYVSLCDHFYIVRPAMLRAFRCTGLHSDLGAIALCLEVPTAWLDDAIAAPRGLCPARPGIALFAFQMFFSGESWRSCRSFGFYNCAADDLAALTQSQRNEIGLLVQYLESEFGAPRTGDRV